MELRVTDLEVRLTYQEKALEELSDVVISQQDQIDRLIAELEALKSVKGENELVRPLSEETPPPHY